MNTVPKRRCPNCGRSLPVSKLQAPASPLGLHLDPICARCRRADRRRHAKVMRVLGTEARPRSRRTPKGPDYLRRHPQANAIAAELRQYAHLLGLRTRLLAGDIRQRFGCSYGTARTAVGIARRSA